MIRSTKATYSDQVFFAGLLALCGVIPLAFVGQGGGPIPGWPFSSSVRRQAAEGANKLLFGDVLARFWPSF